jgi:hypothetical protein
MLNFQDVSFTCSLKNLPGDDSQAAKKEQCEWYTYAFSKRVLEKRTLNHERLNSFNVCYPA